MRKKIYLGKVDGYHNGRKCCKAFFEYELTNEGNFSMSAKVWNLRETNIIRCGQCCEDVFKMVTMKTIKIKRMVEIWKRYHLNDMRAGCIHQRQMKWEDVRINPNELPNSHANRDEKGILASWVYESEHPAGLLCKPCPECGYEYGTAWLKEEIPEDIKKEILSW